MPGSRSLSQRISEGDGIAIIVCVDDADGARDAERQGAKALAVAGAIDGIRDATTLPLLWIGTRRAARRRRSSRRPEDDARPRPSRPSSTCATRRSSSVALEQLDPEIFLLSAHEIDDDADPLDAVLELLPDVPAGKLAIAQVDVRAATRCWRSSGPASTRCSCRRATSPTSSATSRSTSERGRGTMARVRGLLALSLLLAACRAASRPAAARRRRPSAAPPAVAPKPRCAHPAGWQKLANRIKAPVYCPGWLPDPLIGQIGGQWNNINSVSPDRSYLESFVWQETGGGAAGGELHVNLRAYPGVTKIPTCRTGGADSQNVPCFADPDGYDQARAGSRRRLYTVNQDADEWHVLLLWRRDGTLYTLSEHVAPPLTYKHVLRYLKQELASLVLIKPAATPA